MWWLAPGMAVVGSALVPELTSDKDHGNVQLLGGNPKASENQPTTQGASGPKPREGPTNNDPHPSSKSENRAEHQSYEGEKPPSIITLLVHDVSVVRLGQLIPFVSLPVDKPSAAQLQFKRFDAGWHK